MRIRWWIAVLALATVVAGCGSDSSSGGDGSDAADASDLSFEYEAEGGDNQIDQTLTIGNRADSAVALTLSFEAIDEEGAVLPDVRTVSAYGVESGRHVIPAGLTDLDVLRFVGEGYRQVADVKVRVDAVEEVPYADGIRDVITADRLSESGEVVPYGESFTSIRLTNPNDGEVSVRVVFMEYEAPPAGSPQQVVTVAPVGELAVVPAAGETTIEVDGQIPQPVGSVKAYFSR